MSRYPSAHGSVLGLPDETLSEIFRLAVLRRGPTDIMSNLTTFRAILHVCGRWRTVAYRYQAFWTMLPLESKWWVNLALERSGTQAVSILMNHASYPRYAILLALQHVDRAKEVFMTDVLSWDSHANYFVTQNAAPRLERLTIQHSLAHDIKNPWSPVGVHGRGISGIFRGHFPLLRDANFFNCRLQPTSPMLSAPLRRLHVQHCGPVWDSYEALLDTLRTLPGMEDLLLSFVLPSNVAEDDGFARGPVDLPKLDKLHLAAHPDQIDVLVRAIGRPAGVDVHLSCVSRSERDVVHGRGSLRAIGNTLGRLFALPDPSQNPYTSMALSCCAFPIVSISCDPHADSRPPALLPRRLVLELLYPSVAHHKRIPTTLLEYESPQSTYLVPAPDARIRWRKLLGFFTGALPLARVQTLCVQQAAPLAWVWDEVLRHTPALRTLRLEGGAAASLDANLAVDRSGMLKARVRTLDALVVRRADLTDTACLPIEFVQRGEGGGPRVEIEACDVEEEVAEVLGEVRGDQVRWDGVLDGFSMWMEGEGKSANVYLLTGAFD
ncbi:hypothetical protein OF83DRAFT_1178220 [Amylostereum chailletii]|nr:hypothetical protein OF83DRAFT_1178220 [Amylostereum chailletii]